jgi:cell division ATPase FtsA
MSKCFSWLGIEPQALEIEALALIRSVIGEDHKRHSPYRYRCKTTSVNLVDNGYLRLSKSLNAGGDTITASLSQSLAVNFARAEQFKKDFGMTPPASKFRKL